MSNRKSLLKYILASAVTVSSLGLFNVAQADSTPVQNNTVKSYSNNTQTPFLVKAKSFVEDFKNTKVVLANKQGIPTGAAANVPDVGLREVTGRTNQTSGTLNADKTKYQNIHYSSSWDIFRPAPTLGGAIHSEVNTTITNSIFRNNEAEGRYIIRDNPSYGGGMYIKGKGLTATINNVLFDSNTASSGSGGAIYSAGGNNNNHTITFNITNATFTNNSATEINNNNYGDGGAIYSDGYTNLTITDTDFTSNSAEGDGGAIYNNANNEMSIIAENSDVNFSNNTASGDGGAIYNASGKTINFSTSNDKTINFLGSTGNDIYNAGTINTAGDINVATKISGNGTLNVNSGTLYVKELTHGTLNLAGGTLSFQEKEGTTPVYSSNSVSTLRGNGNILIDVSMSDARSDVLRATAANSGTVVNLAGINVHTDYGNTASESLLTDYITYMTGGGLNNITFQINGSTSGELVTQTSSGMSYTFTLGADGKLTVNAKPETEEGLREFIRGTLSENTDNFSFVDDLQLEYGEAVGTTNNDTYRNLNLNFNGYNLTGENLDGITVADGYTLNLLGDAGTPSTISKFVTAFINEGTLNVQNITFSDNTTAIDNDGTLSLSGTNVFNSNVSGTGSTSITGGSTTVSGGTTFNQNSLSISTDAELANAGTITSAINNGGTLTNTNVINGDITNSGTVTNSGSITGKLDNTNIVTNTGTITTANGTNSGSITNTNGVINTNGGSNSGSITGGTTNVQGTFSNSGTISSGTVNLKNGATLTQANGGSLNLTSFTNDTNGGTLNLSGNNQIDNVNLGNVALGSVLTANLDINSSTIDSITASNSSNGVINVILSNTTAPVIDTTYSVINGGGDNLSITLGSTVADKQKVWTDEALIDALGTIYNWSDKAGKYNQEVTDTYHFEVVDKHNLAYVLDEALRERGGKEYTGYYDLLQKLNQSDASTREFNATSASETYTVKDVDGVTGETITGLGTTARGKLTVNGVASGDNKSIIDGNGKTLFELTLDKDGDTNTQVELNNVKIINAVNVATVAADNELTLNNVEINGTTSKAITSAGAISVEDSAFINNTSADNGGAVYLSKIPGVTEFKNVLFEGNTVAIDEVVADGISGGTIYIEAADTTNTNPNDSVYIFDNVTFDSNGITSSKSTGRGGAIYVYEPTSTKNNVVEIKNSSFVNNYLNINSSGKFASGGAIYNNGKISLIKGTTFEGNDASSNKNTSSGGAICNNKGGAIISSIENVVFTGNSASGNESRGGAVQNSGSITFNGTNTFTENTANASSKGFGGAVYNDSEIVFNGTTTFTGNSVTASSGDGGAIYNGFADNDNNKNVSLTFNGTATFSENKVNGVLNDIYNKGTINFGTGSTTTFNGGVNGSKGTLKIASGATINLGGVISNNTIQMSGGTINLGTYTPVGTTDVNYGNLNLVGITTTSGTNLINAINDSIQNINLGNATLTNALNANLDITSTEIDHFTVADGSTGTINVTLSDTTAPVLDKIYQVVYGDDNNVVITLTSTVDDKTKDWVDSQTDTINPVHNWGDTIGEYDQDVTDTYHFEVVDNHSLAYVLDESMRQRGDKDYQTYYDVLHRLNILETTEDREFNASSASETYVVGANIDPDKTESITGLGTTSRGKLTVNGVASGNNKSTIDGNGKTLFELTQAKDGNVNTQVEINNTKITNAAKVATVGSDNELILNNVEISGNTAGITNNGTLTLSGTNTISNHIDGNSGTAQLTGGKTSITSGTNVAQNIIRITAGELANAGTIISAIDNGGTLTNTNVINGDITNTSTLTNTGGTITGDITNSGTVTNSGSITGRLDNTNIVTNTGTITTSNGTNSGSITNTNGVINANGGSNSGSIADGSINVSGSFENSGVLSNSDVSISANSKLNYITNSNNTVFNSRLSGGNSAEFNKSGATELQITGNQSGFAGIANVNEGTLSFAEASGNAFFANDSIINVDNISGADSLLKYTSLSGKTLSGSTFPTINLKNGGTFDYIAGSGVTNINSGFYNSIGSNNKLVFEGGNADAINLNSDFHANDTATFKNSNLSLGTNSFSSSIELKDNSTLNLMNQAISDYTFASLMSDDTAKVTVDVSLGSNPTGDKIITSGGNGIINVTQFAILDDNGLFTTPDNSKTVQIIKNNNGSSLSLAASGAQIKGAWSTNVYEYEISSTQTDTENDSMKFTGIKVSDANSLKKMNNYNNNTAQNLRGFSVVSGSSPYHIGEDLGKTEPGTFTVNGVSKDESIISGVRAEGSWTSVGEKGSMFELTDSAVTNFNLNNLTVQDAAVSTRGGSVIYSTSDNASVVVDNVNFKDNTSTGNGGAFDIEKANSISISNSSFTGNKTSGLGGAIYSAADLLITNTDFSGNTAGGVANDIYLAGGADVLYTTGTNGNTISGGIASATTSSVFSKRGSTDLDISGNNSGYIGQVNIEEGKLNFTAKTAGDSLFDTSNSFVTIAEKAQFNIDDKGLTNLSTANVNGLGTINKSGSGTLNVGGDNDGFSGVLNIKDGEVSYKEQNAGDTFFGASSIAMSDGTKLNVETTSSSGQQGGNISSTGSTEFNKSGVGVFDLIGANTIGTVNVKEGTLNVENNASGTRTYNATNTDVSEDATLNYTTGKDSQLTKLSGSGDIVKKGNAALDLSDYTFTGNADVESGKLVVTSATQNARDLDFNVKSFGSSEFEYNAAANSKLTLDGNSKFAFDSNASGATAKFSNAEVVLGNITNVADNNVIINNSPTITLAVANYAGNYSITDSVLDVMDSNTSQSISDSIKSYTFDKLSVNNVDLMLDVSLGNVSGSDVLNVTDGNGTFSLAKLAIVDDNGVFENEDKTKTFQVINNTNGNVGLKITQGNPKIADWSTTIYEYEINAVKSDDANDYYDSVEFKGIRISSPDTLRIMNHERSNARGFSVVGTAIYHIAQDLDTTLEGDFAVTGNGKTASVISGNRVDYTKNADGTITISEPKEGEYGSFFELTQKNTSLTVQNLTIQEAQRSEQAIKDGSIVYLNNGSSSATLNNVLFKDSSAVNGGVIANKLSESLVIKDSDFTNNTASANGGAIYNASTGMTLSGVTADGNKADGKGGAIYTNANMQITDSSFGVTNVNQHKNGNSNYVSNDIYVDGENTKLTYTTTDNTSVINSGIAGNGTVDKTGNGTLNLRGNNTDFTGTMKITSGGVLFTQNSENDTYISGATNVGENANLTLQNDKSNITPGKFIGNGTINQTGSKDLILDADNSGFHGNAVITGGNLIVKDNSFFASDSSTSIANVIEFNTSASKEIAINNDGDLITGSGSLKKTGDGKLVLSGNNSALTGGTDIESGTLEFGTDGTATDSMVSGNINVNNNTFNVKNTSASSAFNLDNNISGTGSFNVKGKVEISGDDSQFTGTTNILSDSDLLFTKTDSNSFVNGTVNAVGNLYYTTDKSGVDTISTVIGSGDVFKSGTGDLTINNTVNGNERFTGLIEASKGTLTVNAAPQATAGEFDYTIQAGHGAIFNYIANASDTYNLNGSEKVDFTDNDSSTINFVNGTYNLISGVPNEDDNTTKFTDATVNSTGTVAFSGNYALNNSVLNTNNGALNNLTFAKLDSTNNSKLNIDFSFGANAADTITSTTAGGSIILDAINVFDKTDDGNNLTRDVRVLNGLTFGNNADYSKVLVSDLYKYTTTIKDNNTLHLVAEDYADALTLYKLNHTISNTRTFKLVKDEPYYAAQDLDTTLAGTLNITGRTEDRADTIVARTAENGDKVSMFNLLNNTNLNIKDITIKDANTSESGSVIYSNNENAKVDIQNSSLQNNTSTKNGGAVAVDKASRINIASSAITGNESSINGGGLYTNNVVGTITNTTFSQNSSTSKGGAVYNDENGNLTLNGATFSNNSSANGGALYNAGDVQISGTTVFSNNSATNGAGLYNAGTATVLSGTSFSENGSTNSEGSAIYNIGTASLTNTTFADNNGKSYIYNGADGTLSLISEKVNDTVTNLTLNNNTGAIIKNNGILNLTAKDTFTITVQDAIRSTAENVKGTINTNGTVAVNDEIVNQILNVVTGQLTVGESGSAVSNALQNVDLTVNSDTNAIINNKNVVGGKIVDKGTLAVVNNSDITISAQLSDSGIINKSGSGKVTVNGDNDNSGFSGTINITDGTVAFETTGAKFVSKDSEINVKDGATLEYNAKDSSYTFADNNFADVKLTGANNNVVISGLGVGNSSYTLNSDWITSNENTNNLTFKNSDYVLNSIFEKTGGAADNITFDSSAITLGSGIVGTQSATHADAKDYNLGSNNFKISNSYLDLSNKTAGDNYDFSSLNFSNDSTFSMDVNLVLDTDAGVTPYGDTFTSNSGSGIVNLTKLFITDDNGMFDSNNEKGIIQVFKGNNDLQVATEDNMTILSWATNVYKYGVTSAETAHTADSIKIVAQGISSTDTLRDLNRYQLASGGGNRGFSFIAKDGKQANNKYNIYRDLDTTSAQNFSVVGTISTDESKNSLLDGTLKPLEILDSDSAELVDNGDGTWTYNGETISGEYVHHVDDIKTVDGTNESGYRIDVAAFTPDGQTQGSMFELVNQTKFEMTNVSVENAKRYSSDAIKDGSVVYANNQTAEAKLLNVDLKNNSVESGNGGAIANIGSKEFSLTNSEISGNQASGNGGAIYNTSSGTVSLQNINAYGNSSTNGLGGAIYTNTNMTIADSDFGVGTLNTDKNGQNDIYIDGANTNLTFSTSENKTSSINSGLAGNGNIIKTGKGTLNLSGANAGLTGVVAVTDGILNYVADDVNDTFAGGRVHIAENSSLVMDISNAAGIQTQSLNNVDGYTNSENVKTSGSIVKKGLGTLNLGGDNSGFTGNTTIKNGSVLYTADEDSDRYLGGTTVIGDSDAQGQTANLTLNVAENVKNQVLTNITSATQSVNTNETITKTGKGNVIVTGDNSGFYGQTTIDNGSLIYKPENTTDKYFSGNTVINTNGTLETQIANATAEGASLANQTIGNISGNGKFVVNNEYTNENTQGKVQLVGTNNFTGLTDIQSGILAYVNNNGDFVSGDIAIDTNGTLEYTTAQDGSISNTITGNGTFNKLGTEILSITGDESGFVGTTNIKEGTLSYDDANGGKFVGGDVNITGTLDYIASQANSTLGNDLSGTGVFNKNGDKTVTITGDNSGFTGVTNINSGTLAYNNANGKFVAGDVNVSGTLDYTTGANTTDTLNNKIVGTGTVAKNGAGELVINNTVNGNNRFTGAMEVNAGTLTVNAAQQATAGEFDYSATVNDGSVLNYNANSADSYTINGNSKFGYVSGSGNSINFKNGTYNLSSDMANASGNTTSFADATVNSTGTAAFSGNYALNNSVLNTNNGALNNLTFAKLDSTNNSKLNIDFSFGANAADTITSTAAGGSLVLNAINLISTSDDGSKLDRTVNVLNGLTFSNTDYSSILTSDLYQYTTTIVNGTTLHLVATDYATADTLYILNHEKSGNRTFQLVGDNKTYYSNKDLKETLAGTLNITGRTTDKADTIVAKTSATDETQHSMFDVANANTTLNISNFTIKDAKTTDNGSVINATASDVVINVQNSALNNNTSGGNGGAIYNASTGMILSGVTADGNKADGKGGAIYTNANMQITDSSFGVTNVNQHKNGNSNYVSNDIYVDGENTKLTYTTTDNTSVINSGIAGNGTVDKTGNGTLNLRGNNTDFTGTMKITSGGVLFTQNSENDTYISGATNVGENANLTLQNDKSNITAGNISGEGTLNKDGSKKVTLTGNNANFTGDTNIKSGTLAFDNAGNNAFVSGKVDVAGTLEYTTTKDGSISNTITGNGTFNKQGDKTLTLAGDAHGFTGITNVNEGTLAYTVGNGEFVGGEVNITGALDYTTGANSSATMTNKLSGSGEFNKLGAGTLTYAGNGAEFSGTTNIASGTLAYNNANGKFVAGDVNVSGTLDYTTGANTTDTLNNKIVGTGTVAKNGAGELVINNTVNGNNRFTGAMEVNAGTLTVNAAQQATAGEFDYSATVNDGSVLNYNANSADSYTINGNSKFGYVSGSGNSINFKNGTYNLSSDMANASGNTTSFADATVNSTGTAAFSGNYALNNSVLNTNNGALNNLTFAKLDSTNNSKLNIDFSFGANAADTITSTTAGGSIILDAINVFDKTDDGNNLTRDVRVLNGLTFGNNADYSKVLVSDLYKYTTTIKDNNTLHLVAEDYADALTLYKLNHTISNTRTFKLVKDEPYYAAQDLDTTLAGTLNITGRTEDRADTIVARTAENGDKVSMFDVANANTTLNISNFTIKDAKTTGNGSVINATASDAVINITNTLIKDNTAGGNGGAIYSAANLVINNSDFEGNSAAEKGNDIYLAGGADVEFTTGASGNTIADGIASETDASVFTKKGSGDLTVSGSNSDYIGTVDVQSGNVNFVAKSENDSFFNAKEIKLSDNTKLNINDKNLTDLTAGNISGTGEFNKEGNKKLTLTGNNSGFTGQTNIKEGTLAYSNATAGNAFVNGPVDVAGTLEYTAANAADLNNVLTGEGELNKKGTQTLTIKGDASGFNGTVDIDAGTVAYNTNSGKLFGQQAKYEISDGASLDITTNADTDSVNIQNLSSNGDNKTATINKNGKGTLNLNGDNSSYDAKLNIKGGSVAYENKEGNSYITGATKIENGAALNYTATNAGTLEDVSGSGTLNKSGSKDLTFNETDNTSFSGTANVNSGKMVVQGKDNATNIAFTTNIADGTLDYTAGANSNLTIGGANSKLAFTQDSTGTANFKGQGTNATTFNLDKVSSMNANTTVGIDNSTIKLVNDNYNTGKYTIKDSIIDLTDTNHDTTERKFDNLEVSGTTKLNIDVDLAPLSGTPKSDVLNVNNGSGKMLIVLNEINVQNAKNNNDDGTHDVYVFDVLTGNSSLYLDADNSTTKWATNVYEYNVDISDDQKGLKMKASQAADENSLKKMNNYEGNRGFQFTDKDNPYVIGEDLEETAKGTFNVVGNGSTVVSGADSNGNADKSFFEVVKDTDLTVKDLTITKAAGDEGSVVVADNEDATIALNDVNITDSESNGDGGAINNKESEDFSINGGTMSGNKSGGDGGFMSDSSSKNTSLNNVNVNNNTAEGNGGAINNNGAGKTTVTNSKLNNNSAGKNGGAINNSRSGDMTVSNSTISGNKADGNGGAVNNTDNAKITLNNDTVSNNKSKGNGGAVNNSGNASTNINGGTMSGNSADGKGGAINNEGSADLTVSGTTFHDNNSKGNGGALNNTSDGDTKLDNITAYNNVSNGLGGAIYTNKDMTITDSDFGVDENGNASVNKDKNGQNDIYVDNGATVTLATNNSDSKVNSGLAGSGNVNKTGNKDLNLSGNNKNFTGDLNVNKGDVNYTQNSANDTYISGTTNINNGSSVTLNTDKANNTVGEFKGNGTLNKEGSKDITLSGDNSNFKGTANINDGGVVYNPDNGTKFFGGKTNLNENGELIVKTNKGTTLPKVNGNGTVTKEGSGDLTLSGNNKGFTGNLDMEGGALKFAPGATLGTINTGTFANGTSINLQNTAVVKNSDGSFTTRPNPASIESLSFNNLVINGKVKFDIDVDLANQKADNIHADKVTVSNGGYLSIGKNSLNVVTDAKSLLEDTIVRVASGALARGNYIRLESEAKSVMGPIQKYTVAYDAGNLTFSANGGVNPDVDSVNPAVMASSVATQVGGFLTQSQTLQDGFFHMNRYMKYARADRLAAENVNRYASESGEMPLQEAHLPEVSQGMWVKPYATFEKVNLRGGYKVENFGYGTLYGGDNDMVDMGSGWKGVLSAFIGYNGNHMNYKGISMDMQGGTLGATGTLYKGNFFTGLTISTGASAGEAYTQYGTDNFSMLTAGIANKTGYNWEINGGKVIIQPSLFTGYTFVNTFDYTNAAGVRMDSDPLHAIQIIPGVKVIGNLKNGWQPYAGVDMVWNIMDSNKVMANDVKLPQLSVKPYVQYGVGVQKSWGERFTAFFQTMLRGGGRNGVALTAGFRWVLGKDKPKDPNAVPTKKVIKKIK